MALFSPACANSLEAIARKCAPVWSDIAKFGQSNIAKSAYIWLILVPLAANTFSKLDSLVHVEFLGHEWGLKLKLPFSWRLLFWASLSASVANVIYSSRCPKIIRDFADYRTFRDATGSGRSLKNLLRTALPPIHKFREHYQTISEFVGRYCMRESIPGSDDNHKKIDSVNEVLKNDELDDGSKSTIKETMSGFYTHCDVVEKSLPDAFEFVRENAEQVRPYSRIAAGLLYGIAVLISAVLIAQNCWLVATGISGSDL